MPTSLMTHAERQRMLVRLKKLIEQLIDTAESTYKTNCYKLETTEVDSDYITRLSTNEFFFYTKEPLTLNEFEDIQNEIATKAQTLPPGIQLILGTFAVKTGDKVMNVAAHITCGESPHFHFIIKNNTSTVDVIYKVPNGAGGTNTLALLDKNTTPATRPPQITVNGKLTEFTFNNIVPCKTPNGDPFLTAVDICIDNCCGVAKKNYESLARQNPDILNQPIFHVVLSNTMDLYKEQCLESTVMHVDTTRSRKRCKKGFLQQKGAFQHAEFGNVDFVTYTLNYSRLMSNYSYQTLSPKLGRYHGEYTVSIRNIAFRNSVSSAEFENFQSKYHAQEHKGDYLKTEILEDFKRRIQKTSSEKELGALKIQLKSSYEYDVLKTGQDWFTKTTKIKTSSVRALNSLFKQQKTYLDEASGQRCQINAIKSF